MLQRQYLRQLVAWWIALMVLFWGVVLLRTADLLLSPGVGWGGAIQVLFGLIPSLAPSTGIVAAGGAAAALANQLIEERVALGFLACGGTPERLWRGLLPLLVLCGTILALVDLGLHDRLTRRSERILADGLRRSLSVDQQPIGQRSIAGLTLLKTMRDGEAHILLSDERTSNQSMLIEGVGQPTPTGESLELAQANLWLSTVEGLAYTRSAKLLVSLSPADFSEAGALGIGEKQRSLKSLIDQAWWGQEGWLRVCLRLLQFAFIGVAAWLGLALGAGTRRLGVPLTVAMLAVWEYALRPSVQLVMIQRSAPWAMGFAPLIFAAAGLGFLWMVVRPRWAR